MRLTVEKKKQVYLPNDDDGAWVEIRYLKPGVRALIESQSNDVSASGSDGELETTVKFNLLKKRKLFLEKVIVSWGGFFDLRDKEMKVTPMNIEKVDNELDNFYSWLSEESDNFIEEVEEAQEAAEGN